MSSRVFNSCHVTFFEHLDVVPSPLLPGTMLGTDRASSPLSWDVVGPHPHPHPPLPPSFPFSSFFDDPSHTNDNQTHTFPSHPSQQTSFPLSQNNIANPRLDSNLQSNNTTTNQQQHNEEEQSSDDKQHPPEEEQPNAEQHHPPQSLIPRLTIKIPP